MGRYDKLFQRVASQQNPVLLESKNFRISASGLVETINFFVTGTIKLDKSINAFHLNKINKFYNTGNRRLAEKRTTDSYREGDPQRFSGVYRFGRGTIFEAGSFTFRSQDGGEGIAGLRFIDETRADSMTNYNGTPIWRAIEYGVVNHRLPIKYGWNGPGSPFYVLEGPAEVPGQGTRGIGAVEYALQEVRSDLGRKYNRIALQSYS